MSDTLQIQPTSQPVFRTVQPPGSKSITNRALVCAALAEGISTLHGALVSEDTEVMIAGLRAFGVRVEEKDGGQTLVVEGCAGKPPAKQANIFVGNSGTTIRFLTALATLGHGNYRLDGIGRMRERPIGDLVDALQLLGAELKCAGSNNCPPVEVVAGGLPGGAATIRGNISSQYLSALLMAAPCAEQEVMLRVDGTLVSVPYVAMTLAVMDAFGITARADANFAEIVVPGAAHYKACAYAIEPDASAASYFWAAAAVTGGEISVTGLSRASLQGDVAFVECLAKMGCEAHYDDDSITVVGHSLRGIDVDMNAISDTVQTLAVVALFAEGPTIIRNVPHIRHKETDRLAALAKELRKLGATVSERKSGLEIVPGNFSATATQCVAIDTYNDHRMAMSFAVAGLVRAGIVIRDPDCTAKTYPDFFVDLEALRAPPPPV
jgi:3-phosphoshikimate 1-carboxyvinyltransferase